MEELLDAEVTLTVNVGIGSTNPQDKINAFMKSMSNLRELLADGVLERYNLDVAEVIKELFGKLGYKNGTRFFKSADGLTPMENAMRATIQELQAKLAQKVDPALVDAQVRKLDAEIEKITASIPAGDGPRPSRPTSTHSSPPFKARRCWQRCRSWPQRRPAIPGRRVRAAGAGVDPDLVAPGAPAPGLTRRRSKPSNRHRVHAWRRGGRRHHAHHAGQP